MLSHLTITGELLLKFKLIELSKLQKKTKKPDI
jgi:hypothetical protein